ncbi:hypothetical protein SNEBB_001182 [Seison nebaliae]|nr:hypothetical protein SNEBB_001182 [Seison nebaliae]
MNDEEENDEDFPFNFQFDFDNSNSSNNDLINTKLREICGRCDRPTKTCICSSYPEKKIHLVKTKVFILQHPLEIRRCLNTTNILEKMFNDSQLFIYRYRRIDVTNEKFPNEFKSMFHPSNIHRTFLLFPGELAKSIDSNHLPVSFWKDDHSEKSEFHVVVIDGTWMQAKGLYYRNRDYFNRMIHIQINLTDLNYKSFYLIRTQARECFVSTLESIAIFLVYSESEMTKSNSETELEFIENCHLFKTITKPLIALVKFQLDNGAVPHDSKESLIEMGKFTKLIGKRTKKLVKGNLAFAGNDFKK